MSEEYQGSRGIERNKTGESDTDKSLESDHRTGVTRRVVHGGQREKEHLMESE